VSGFAPHGQPTLPEQSDRRLLARTRLQVRRTLGKCLFCAFPIGDIPPNRLDLDDTAVEVSKSPHDPLRPPEFPGTIEASILDGDHRPVGPERFEGLGHPFTILRIHHQQRVPAHEILRAASEILSIGAIDEGQCSLGRETTDQLRLVLDDGTIARLTRPEGVLEVPSRRHIAQHQDHPQKTAGVVANGGRALVNRNFLPMPAEQDRVIGEVALQPIAEHSRHRIVHSLTTGLVQKHGHVVEGAALDFVKPPTDQRLRRLVHEPHRPIGVGGEYSVADVPQGGVQPGLALAHGLLGVPSSGTRGDNRALDLVDLGDP
jgi:hypothetical protein